MSSEGAKPEHLSGAISFKNIKFAYPTRPNLYIYGGPQAPEGLNLEIKAGETVAMVSFVCYHKVLVCVCSVLLYVHGVLTCQHKRCQHKRFIERCMLYTVLFFKLLLL
jgi:hypothetical protein